ncbi:AGZA family xanthine/uracil permease-like MFS transporter [Scopulibacillus darangshiensis]|uniref:AGZA family xanthine/uracil permease-like MFS transporter n=1 Tax=Scopulibacillus darangshiensis TaxID=442528 RepID=A0A4R2NWN9_9BACL|nr:NCS2 family permease [Scopulibacillus darangshiensis]TCP26599.1 AGZA family xanthine/uracil permease-like MFS transporter [Scopulibacillus darangshiensis]
MFQLLIKHFRLKENKTNVKKEAVAGLTAFFTAAYIIIINPLILKDAGIPLDIGVTATILSSIAGCLIMGLWANSPIIQIPGMGVNAFFTYTIVQSAGLTAEQALAVVFCSGFIFLFISFSRLSKALSIGIPETLKHGITVGIGLFLAFIGLQKGGLVVSGRSSFVALGNLSSHEALLTLFGLIITCTLFVRKVKGSFIIGMLVTTCAYYLLGPATVHQATTPSLKTYMSAFGSLNFTDFYHLPFILSVFSLTMLIVFENMGLLHGMLPNSSRFDASYKSAAASSILSALFGTSPTISAAESASGIQEGGKTGLTSVIAAMLFGLSFIAIPVIGFIPNSAVAPILIILGALMMQNVRYIPFHDFSESFPAFLIILLIPLTFSIADGLAFGFIAYPLLKLLLGKARQVSRVLYVIAFLFLLNFIAGTIMT